MPVFAPNLPRNSQDWIILPDDVTWRKSLFPEGVMKHLAKMHMALEQAIYQYVSKPSEVKTITPELLKIMEKEVNFCNGGTCDGANQISPKTQQCLSKL